MIHVHDLNGCAPAPLAHYLKALGILRLVAEQADPQARGWWEGERFRLATTLDPTALETFFLERYEPTPLVAPWNGGTGFYPKDKKAKRAIDDVTSHQATRFTSYRQAIADALKAVGQRREAPEKKEKEQFLIECLRDWRGPHREAMAAAVVLGNDGKPGYPALLGTGFNDGRLDFTSNFMGRLLHLFPSTEATPQATVGLLREACWKSLAQDMDAKGAIGQFMPGSAGGANSTTGPEGDPFSNPWDFVLMLEGTVLFTAHATLRLGIKESSRAAAPFVVNARGAGYASAADSDESARGEQWMPLWSQPITLSELKRLLAEGRAQIGAKPVRDPLDLARAVARLGTARGITAFQRYGYIVRNGQSNLAVPLGRFHVPDHISPNLMCLDDLDAWLPRLLREARNNNAPNRLKLTERRLADALFAVTEHPDEPSRWQSVLLALADVEAVQITGSGFKAWPIPKLRPEWMEAANDSSVELRLALSFALQANVFSRESGMPLDPVLAPVRRHWLPLDKEKPWKYATTGTGNQTRIQTRSDAVIQGRRGIDDAIAMVGRRVIEGAQRGERRLPLQAAIRAAAHPADLSALIAGIVDIDRTLALGRALMALDRELWPQQFISLGGPQHTEWPDDAWLSIRLAMLPWPLPDGRRIAVDPAILRRLESGNAATAVELALRRLGAAGIHPTVRAASVSPETARLWAAALAFPISRRMATAFVRRLDPHSLI